MRLSEYFLPLLRENPSEAQIVSHRLMVRAGMIRQSSAGIYSWLPLGLRVLKKVERIVREEQDRAGALEILMPTVQPAELWRESGRYDDYGKEMLRIRDRHDREMLYGPTNEEQVTEIVRASIKRYRDLPKLLYHIQWKFRDEVRPRFGVMRGREFLMKDAYSFDLDAAGAKHSYNKMFVAYLRTFARMGLKAIPMRADTGPIGGDLSHEFIILAETGESGVSIAIALGCRTDILAAEVDYRGDLEPMFRQLDRSLCRDRREARSRGVPDPARGIGNGAGHRGRSHLLFRRQVFAADGRLCDRPRRPSRGARDGILRHWCVAARRRADRSEPRRCWHHLAGKRRAVPRRSDQSSRRPTSAAAKPPTASTANCSPPGSRCSTTTATNPRAPNSRQWI